MVTESVNCYLIMLQPSHVNGAQDHQCSFKVGGRRGRNCQSKTIESKEVKREEGEMSLGDEEMFMSGPGPRVMLLAQGSQGSGGEARLEHAVTLLIPDPAACK